MRLRKISIPVLALLFGALIFSVVQAHGPDEKPPGTDDVAISSSDSVLGPAAACDGGTAPVVEGPVTLTECFQKNITVGGNARKIRVWYTTDTNTYTVNNRGRRRS